MCCRDGNVEELEAGADEPLHAGAVEPRDSRELVVVGEVERGDEERQHLRVLDANAVVRGRRQAELATQPPEQVGRSVETRAQLLEGLEPGRGLGQEEAHRKRELARRDALRDRLERDPGLLECSHQTDDVDVGRRKEAVLVRGEQPERLEAVDVAGGAGDELGELLRGELGHAVTVVTTIRRGAGPESLGCFGCRDRQARPPSRSKRSSSSTGSS